MGTVRNLNDAELGWLRMAWASQEIGVREIMEHLHLGGSTLMRLRADLQLGPKGWVWTDERRAEAFRLSAQGWRPLAIAKHLGTTKNAVYGVLKRRGTVIGGVLLQPPVRPITPEYEAMLRRVAAWDAAAANGLAALERQRASQ